MKCIECDREISIGRRILFGGIKYVCSTDSDVEKCKEIQKQKRIEELENDPIYIQQKSTPPNAKCNNCGHEFFSCFPMESLPPCDNCPKCKSLVYDDYKKYKQCITSAFKLF